MKYLGIDYGTKRIGLAIGDSETKIAVVFGTVADIAGIVAVVKKEEIDAVVLGAPYSLVSDKHALPENFQKFLTALKAAVPGKKIILEDERLSSKYADSLAGSSKTKAGRDEIAAVSILQNYLDKQ